MFKRFGLVLLILATVAVTPTPSPAQFIKPLEQTDLRDSQVMGGLYATVSSDAAFAKVRGGGASNKPIGQYLVEPNFVFKSAYKDVSTDLQVKFAYDLHEFVKAKGRDWPSMQRNVELKFLEYDKQRDFADLWWKRNYETYKNMGWFFHDAFLMDAMADATNIYNWYYRQGHTSANYLIWEDAALQELCKKH